MLDETLLSAESNVAGYRSSQSTKGDYDLPTSPQRLLAGSNGMISPTVAHGLYVVVETTEHCIDHGLYLATPSTAAPSPQVEKIPWKAPYTVAQFSHSGKTPWTMHSPRPSSGYFISKRQIRRCSIIGATTVLAIVIILGVALGVGLTASRTIDTLLTSTLVKPTNGPAAMHTLMFNDTSIAALETEDRHRHMFYQTTNGSIQHAVYSNKWSFQDLGLSNARSRTPISAVSSNGGTVRCNVSLSFSLTWFAQIYLFYITNNNVLTSTRMAAGSWEPYPMSMPLEISTQTRQLVASRVPSYETDASDFQLFVLTQRPGDSVSLIHLSTNLTQSSFKQIDVTAFLNGSTGGRSFNSPCAVVTNVSNVSVSYAPFLSSRVNYSWVGVFSGGSGNPADGIAGAGYDGKQLSYCKLVPCQWSFD